MTDGGLGTDARKPGPRIGLALGARVARGVGCAADGAHGRAGDDGGHEAQLVEGLQHQHMGKPARRAAAERQANARARRAHVLPARVSRFRLDRRRLRGGGRAAASAATAGNASAV